MQQQQQEQCYPLLSMCVVFLRVQTTVWPPVFGIFNMHTDVNVCDCTQRLYGLHWKLTVGEKSLAVLGTQKPALLLCLAFQSDALPTELSPSLLHYPPITALDMCVTPAQTPASQAALQQDPAREKASLQLQAKLLTCWCQPLSLILLAYSLQVFYTVCTYTWVKRKSWQSWQNQWGYEWVEFMQQKI